jgi:hypothetical protein
MADPEVKLRWYRELGRVTDERTLDGIAEELRDRFGPPPPEVANLLDITRIKLRALEGGISEIRGLRHGVRMVFAGDRQPDSPILQRLIDVQRCAKPGDDGRGEPRSVDSGVPRGVGPSRLRHPRTLKIPSQRPRRTLQWSSIAPRS